MRLLDVDDVWKTFERNNRNVYAVNGVSFGLDRGESLGVIGESGSGKSTLGRLVLRLLEPDAGRVIFDGTDLTTLTPKQMRLLRSEMQVVFQEPYEQLDPRMRVGQIVREPLEIHKGGMSRKSQEDHAREALRLVGLASELWGRLPKELSGGQQQRVGIARAIVTRPKFLLLDEPTSSLDLSIRGQILELLTRLRAEMDLTFLFISHDIDTVEYICTNVAVMYGGQIVEYGPTQSILSSPNHPYTKALLSARLSPDPRVSADPQIIAGDPVSPETRPYGCVFYSRCPISSPACNERPVPLLPLAQLLSVQCACIKVKQVAP